MRIYHTGRSLLTECVRVCVSTVYAIAMDGRVCWPYCCSPITNRAIELHLKSRVFWTHALTVGFLLFGHSAKWPAFAFIHTSQLFAMDSLVHGDIRVNGPHEKHRVHAFRFSPWIEWCTLVPYSETGKPNGLNGKANECKVVTTACTVHANARARCSRSMRNIAKYVHSDYAIYANKWFATRFYSYRFLLITHYSYLEFVYYTTTAYTHTHSHNGQSKR